MPSQNEQTVTVLNQGSGKNVRTIELTTLINGVVTTVEMQVLAIADGQGNIIDDFAGYRFQLAIIHELKEIKELLGRAYGQAVFTHPSTPIGNMNA
jgi:hypothetical protein